MIERPRWNVVLRRVIFNKCRETFKMFTWRDKLQVQNLGWRAKALLSEDLPMNFDCSVIAVGSMGNPELTSEPTSKCSSYTTQIC